MGFGVSTCRIVPPWDAAALWRKFLTISKVKLTDPHPAPHAPRPRLATRRLAVRRSGGLPQHAQDACRGVREEWPLTGGTGRPHGRFPALRFGRGGAKMAFVLPIRDAGRYRLPFSFFPGSGYWLLLGLSPCQMHTGNTRPRAGVVSPVPCWRSDTAPPGVCIRLTAFQQTRPQSMNILSLLCSVSLSRSLTCEEECIMALGVDHTAMRSLLMSRDVMNRREQQKNTEKEVWWVDMEIDV
jgi:hypothetical protein